MATSDRNTFGHFDNFDRAGDPKCTTCWGTGQKRVDLGKGKASGTVDCHCLKKEVPMIARLGGSWKPRAGKGDR